MIRILEEAKAHALPQDVVHEELVIKLPTQDVEEMFKTVVAWGRFAELFGYSPETEAIYARPVNCCPQPELTACRFADHATLRKILLPDVIVSIRFDQPLEHLDIRLHALPAFGIGRSPGLFPTADDGHAGDDIHAIADRRVDRFKMMVQRQQCAIGFEHQCIAVVAIGLGKRSIDGDRFAAAFDRRLTCFDFHRHVAVND